MKILLVYNPFAGHKRGEKLLPQIEGLLTEKKIDFDLRLTDYPEHAMEIVSQTNFREYDGIVAAGGDGTLFEVINGYFKNRKKGRIPLGVLPTGTGNAFARDLDIDVSRWEEAVEIIHAGQRRKVDVGHFRTHGQDYYYLNIMGLGFVADVTKTALAFKFLGNVSYTLLRLRARYPDDDTGQLAGRLAGAVGRDYQLAAVRQQLRRARLRFAQLLVEEVSRSLDEPTPDRVEQELVDTGLMEYIRDFLPSDWRETGQLRETS